MIACCLLKLPKVHYDFILRNIIPTILQPYLMYTPNKDVYSLKIKNSIRVLCKIRVSVFFNTNSDDVICLDKTKLIIMSLSYTHSCNFVTMYNTLTHFKAPVKERLKKRQNVLKKN